jgi:hypothetical protein
MSASPRNMVFPVVLIIVGLLILAHNLGYIGFAQLRDLLATWWPLILIAVGVTGLVNRGK